jgi:hypothetical protein
MGKRKGSKSGGSAQVFSAKPTPTKTYESDEESHQSDDVLQFDKSKNDDSDDEDNEVFDLALGDDDVRFSLCLKLLVLTVCCFCIFAE